MCEVSLSMEQKGNLKVLYFYLLCVYDVCVWVWVCTCIARIPCMCRSGQLSGVGFFLPWILGTKFRFEGLYSKCFCLLNYFACTKREYFWLGLLLWRKYGLSRYKWMEGAGSSSLVGNAFLCECWYSKSTLRRTSEFWQEGCFKSRPTQNLMRFSERLIVYAQT